LKLTQELANQETSMKQAARKAGFLHGLLLNPEDGCEMFARKVV
jgi:hypothetical protein